MGLPLFIAPVESDVPAQVGDKSAATRHPRSTIRRARRSVDARPFRRRAALLRDNFPTPGPEPVPRARYPWIESGHPPPPEAYVAPPSRSTPPVNDRRNPAAEIVERANDARNRQFDADASEARLISLYGDEWILNRMPRPSGANVAPPTGEEDVNWQEPDRAQLEGSSAYADFRERRRFRRAQLDRMSMPAPPVAARFDRSPEHATSARFAGRMRRPEVEPRPDRTTYNQRVRRMRPFGHLIEASLADGLGDRNRSISPDEDGVWDTLLTTLTPDPQPPSAGSSFASASASASASQSQSAGASSRTSVDRPERAEESTEQPCESGLDNSDSEGHEDLHMERGWPDHWTMNYPSRHRRFVADLDANDPSRISFVRADRPFSGRDNEEMRSRRRLELARHYRIATRDPTPLPELLDHIVRDSSEESRDAGGPGEGDGDTAPPSRNDSSNDNALEGMQEIVRHLARRQDIPDEWWAGAGLSRTLPEES
ncbi:hypothetical protein CORC01_13838 [Colletotrichum orchidophilum]|uniref:Uncharacterized protein n=1 Tax=Colletotrichum orchidophilum TaxID=1209926 RepID=A0A1G4AP20_9PEZI|nr:uncharacterized protein CORC01_13838 [Colletotrichum orchidophilum]OHE90861.1 hypothetical protein CORC01_13838 [Colletotrichum orchidophilum]